MKTTFKILLAVCLILPTFSWGITQANATQLAAQPPLGVAPAGKTTTILTIWNRCPVAIERVSLDGQKNYSFANLKPGRSSFTVERGDYIASYSNFNGIYTKKLKLNSNKFTYTVWCAYSRMVFVNKTGAPIDLKLTGRVTYQITLPAKQLKFIAVYGQYSYQAKSVCGQKTGTIKINFRRIRWTFTCEE